MSLAAKLLSASGGADKLYVDDVFSAFTYTGNSSTQTITNGIDLAGKGGLVWTKKRSTAASNYLINTVRGALKHVISDTTAAEVTSGAPYTLTAFNSNGYTLGANADLNQASNTYVGWTFRKAPKFFDVVTYTGNGASSRAIAHSLGQEVGVVMTKATSTTGNWNTYHRSATGDLVLNTSDTQTGSKALVNSATTSTFTVSGAANTNGVTYVAYLFAHDPSADGIIQCGSFTTDGSGGASVTLGWEPQYVLGRRPNAAGNWEIVDTSRGMPNSAAGQVLWANLFNAEFAQSNYKPTATGFMIPAGVVAADHTFIYLAIRRPNKPPTTGTEVYNAIARTGTGAAAVVTGVGFAPDLVITTDRNKSDYALTLAWDRLRGALLQLYTAVPSGETSLAASVTSFNMDGVSVGTARPNVAVTYINHFFKRALGVFDEVCYTGTGAFQYVAHGLGAVPELILIKKRSTTGNWVVMTPLIGWNYIGYLNTTAAFTTVAPAPFAGNSTTVDFQVYTSTDVNASAATFVAYLFATKAGISKVGSYVGNGSNQTINCGFTTGARFILIKRTDAVGDWFIWDTVRGIIAGSDPHLSLNSTAAEDGSDDSIDPDTSGFIVNQLTATNINVNGAGYIYLAFA